MFCIVGDDGSFGVVVGVGLVSTFDENCASFSYHGRTNVRTRQDEAFSLRGGLFQTQSSCCGLANLKFGVCSAQLLFYQFGEPRSRRSQSHLQHQWAFIVDAEGRSRPPHTWRGRKAADITTHAGCRTSTTTPTTTTDCCPWRRNRAIRLSATSTWTPCGDIGRSARKLSLISRVSFLILCRKRPRVWTRVKKWICAMPMARGFARCSDTGCMQRKKNIAKVVHVDSQCQR